MCKLLVDGEGAEETPREARPFVCKPSSRAVAQSSIQVCSTPSSISASGLPATPSPSNGCERSPRLRNGSSTMRIPSAKILCAHLVFQETHVARDRRTVHSAGEMADERTRHARIEHDRHLARRHFARLEPLDGAFARRAADRLRAVEIGGVAHVRIVVVALHAGAFAGDGRDGEPVAGAEIGAAKTVARHQHHAADSGGGGGAAGLGHAAHAQRSFFRRARELFQIADARQCAVDQVEIRKFACELPFSAASPANLSSGATRAIATARWASSETSPPRSLLETIA